MAASLGSPCVVILSLVIVVTCLTTAPAHGAAGVLGNNQQGKLKDNVRDVPDSLRNRIQDTGKENLSKDKDTIGSEVQKKNKDLNPGPTGQDKKNSTAGISSNSKAVNPGESVGANRNPSSGKEEFEVESDVTALNDDVDLSGTDVTDDQQMKKLFSRWQKRHRKSFNSIADQDSSLLRLRRTAERVKVFNARRNTTYKMGLNAFSDWSFDQVKRYLLGYIDTSNNTNSNNSSNSNSTLGTPHLAGSRSRRAPTARDWSTEGYVAGVKNQGSCASCWAFTAASALEAAYKKRYGFLTNLSPQEFVDCASPYIGCGGGQTYGAIGYANRYHRLASLSSYPYISQYGNYQSCRRGSTTPVSIPTASCTQVTSNDDALLDALATFGPIATAVSVADGFQNYRSGILSASACGSTLNHAVLLVGYGVDSYTGLKYWKVKNTWGSNWGENGYVRINRNQLNACGLNKEAFKVTIS